MDVTTHFSEASLEQQITTRYGILLSQTQLAELLGRTPGGLRYSLSYPSDQHTRDLKASGRKIGRRVYYRAAPVTSLSTNASLTTDACPGQPGACWPTCSRVPTTGRCG